MKATVISEGTEIATISTKPYTFTLHEDDDVVRRVLEEMDRLTDWETSDNTDEEPTSPSEAEVDAASEVKFSNAVGDLRSRGYRVSVK